MDFGEILRVIRRRWYVTAPGVVLTIAVALTSWLLVPTKYQSTSTLSLINSPRAVTAPGNGNPFLTFESSLTATADFLSRSLMSEDTARELKAMGVTEEYTAALADNAMGPFVTLTVTGTNKAHVLQSTIVLTEFATNKLQEMQEQSGAPENSMIKAATIIPPQPPESVLKKKIEIVAGATGLLLALTFVITFATENILRSRRRPVDRPDAPRARPEPVDDHTAEIALPRPRRRQPSPDSTIILPAQKVSIVKDDEDEPVREQPKIAAVYRSGSGGRRSAGVDVQTGG
jgi:hypothetical protein